MNNLEENVFTTIKHPKNLSTQIEEQLLDAINKGVFNVGDYLPSENKLVEIFGVSRGVIREALLKLTAKGMIEIKKGKGAKVLKPSIDVLLDPFSLLVNYKCGNKGLQYAQEVRMLIEPQIVICTAQKRQEEDINKLEICIEKMEENKGDNKLLSLYDIEFHKIIWITCGNPMFTIILEPIFHFLKTYHQEMFYDTSVKEIDVTLYEHKRILEAIKNRNGELASQAMRQHLFTYQNES